MEGKKIKKKLNLKHGVPLSVLMFFLMLPSPHAMSTKST